MLSLSLSPPTSLYMDIVSKIIFVLVWFAMNLFSTFELLKIGHNEFLDIRNIVILSYIHSTRCPHYEGKASRDYSHLSLDSSTLVFLIWGELSCQSYIEGYTASWTSWYTFYLIYFVTCFTRMLKKNCDLFYKNVKKNFALNPRIFFFK